MKTFKYIFHSMPYVSWIVIFIFLSVVITIHSKCNDFPLAMLLDFLVLIVCAMPIIFEFDYYDPEETNLYKYDCSYHIKSLVINEETYYFPVITMILKSGYRCNRIIKIGRDSVLTGYSEKDIDQKIARDYENIHDLAYNSLCFKNIDEASFAISECQKRILKQIEIRKGIKYNKDIKVKFEQL